MIKLSMRFLIVFVQLSRRCNIVVTIYSSNRFNFKIEPLVATGFDALRHFSSRTEKKRYRHIRAAVSWENECRFLTGILIKLSFIETWQTTRQTSDTTPTNANGWNPGLRDCDNSTCCLHSSNFFFFRWPLWSEYTMNW